MFKRPGLILLLGLLGVFLVAAVASRLVLDSGYETVEVSTAARLGDELSRPRESLSLHLAPGEYVLTPSAAVDSSCGNCEDPDQPVPITVGLEVSGRNVWIVGPEEGEAVIRTNAGYGIFFRNCDNCGIAGVTVTGGERDTASDATDAAIVAKNSRVSIIQNRIADNIGDSTTVTTGIVGIMGICGRENSFLWIQDNRIIRNSWDGIALYRGAEAEIEQNLVDGVDKARGSEAGGGRGVGIGVTWDARAKISRNVVRRYWKGIGVFVDAHAVVQENVIEEMLTWGIAFWDAGKGRPWVFVENNVIYDCGACGASITRETPFEQEESPGGFVGNVIVKTGQNPKYDAPDYYCYQCALAGHAVPDRFAIDNNLFYDNRRASDDLFDEDVSPDEFSGKMKKHLESVLASAPDWFWRHSTFLQTYAADIED
jgi:hypothetical protein